LGAAVFFSIFYEFATVNTLETKTLVPQQLIPIVSWNAILSLIGTSPDSTICVSPLNNMTCASGIFVTSTYGVDDDFTKNCEWSLQQCTVTISCLNCTFPTNGFLQVSFLEPGTYATGINYTFTSYSGYPNQYSTVWGSLSSNGTSFIRSLSTASLVDLLVTATQYDDTISDNLYSGYKLDYLGSTLGTEVGPEQFSEQNGLAFIFQFQTSDISLKVTLSSRLTQLQLVSQVLGTLAGLMGAIRVAMAIVEKCETRSRKYLKMEPSTDDKHFEEFTTNWSEVRRQTTHKGLDNRVIGEQYELQAFSPQQMEHANL